MSIRNTSRGYGRVARGFHWLMAVLIVVAIGLGLYTTSLPAASDGDIARLFGVFSIHKTLGVTLLALALLRLGWSLTQPRPAPLHPERRTETLLAATVHWALYGGMILMPLSGLLRHASAPGDFARILWPFGQRLPGLPVDQTVSAAFSAMHRTGWLLLAGLIVLHVAGVLKHRLIDRDATLARMTGRGDLPEPPAGPRLPGFVAPLLALAIWSAAITFAVTRAPEATAPMPTATAPASAANWQIEKGTLRLSVLQGSSPVSGSFAAWTAAIAYDAPSRTGHVEVSIPLDSLFLGAITKAALGPGFLMAEAHPRAIFEADILPEGTDHVARGTLQLAGAEVPVALPFALTITGDTATMTGQTVLDRRDFGIGAGYADEGTVGFRVTVDVALTAKRQ
ncbi:cytochrome b/b6 domain-containing protein [uncultured Paracoccus sp.]|uniref:cytochrome b/b6 domain-containing protein n=1 Tax=uncultured Paracoccus sp. TaxID=189685 RepID=UPI0026134062|nr:cytochrome b/b6 domain-containing protein [uncultured Paracoccus sp.]